MAIVNKPVCPYCDSTAELATGREIYPHRPDLHEKNFYRCEPCGAYVGCHPGTVTPLGGLANAELRRARSAAHAAFDPLWRDGTMKRRAAYQWLADGLGIDRRDCHIGHFDLATCERALELCALREPQAL